MTIPEYSVGNKFESATWVVSISIVLIWLFLVPSLWYYPYKFWIYREHKCIDKRYPQLTIAMTFSIFIFIGFERPFLMIIAFEIYNAAWFRFIQLFLYVCSLHSIFYIALLRFWLTYFDLQYFKTVSTNEWKQLINSEGKYDNFFIVQKSKYGNLRYLLRYWIPWLSVSIIISTICFIFGGSAGLLIDICMLLIPIIVTLIIWKKTPDFVDLFRIRGMIVSICIIYFCLQQKIIVLELLLLGLLSSV